MTDRRPTDSRPGLPPIEVAADVANGRLDLGIVTLPLHTRELETQSLTNDGGVLEVVFP